ncbi:MAG: glycosyltransferase [Muribaculaceae bacterium]|nr:glycosyltransferase [Muribaculaceae bacterium]
MKVALICKSDSTGGAAVVTFRLMNALRARGVDARMIVAEKLTDSPYVICAASSKRALIPFAAERLHIFVKNGFNRSTLFQIDNALCGLSLHKIPFVKEADIVCLNWVNQGLMSLRGVRELAETGKPIVWTMHDMWNMTGICHHAGDCRRFLAPDGECGECPLLCKKASTDDLSHRTWVRKQKLYHKHSITFVAVSHWLAETARKSTLMQSADINVIPNAFPDEYLTPKAVDNSPKTERKIRIIFGAARLDDPIKGLPTLVRATQILKEKYPDIAKNIELVTFGGVKDAVSLDGLAIKATHLGKVAPEQIREIYESGDIVVSTSIWETLPGTLIEGQAWGCIPVALDHGGQGDIIGHLSTGYLAPWSDNSETRAHSITDGIAWAVEEIHTNDAAIKERMHNSIRARFSEEVVAKNYIALFNKIL